MAKVGKIVAWRKLYYFDDKSRLIEEIFTNYDLSIRSKIYTYEGNDTNPTSVEPFIDNRSIGKELYKYEEYDKEGNWTKRTKTTSLAYSQGRPQLLTEVRSITYY